MVGVSSGRGHTVSAKPDSQTKLLVYADQHSKYKFEIFEKFVKKNFNVKFWKSVPQFFFHTGTQIICANFCKNPTKAVGAVAIQKMNFNDIQTSIHPFAHWSPMGTNYNTLTLTLNVTRHRKKKT